MSYDPRKGRNYAPSSFSVRVSVTNYAPADQKKPTKASTWRLPRAKDAEPSRHLVLQGPRALGFTGKPPKPQGGPGNPPAGFVGGTTSLTEWYVYWALTKILGPEGDSWAYQNSYQGGRHIPGGSVVDFVVYQPMKTLLIRVQTFRFHFTLGSQKQAYDVEQYYALSDLPGYRVIDVYEQDFIDDPTGGKVLKVMIDALNGEEHANPLAFGTVFPL